MTFFRALILGFLTIRYRRPIGNFIFWLMVLVIFLGAIGQWDRMNPN